MKYKGKELILDNFRTLLNDFSVDVQDVVRSAVLDGVDIGKYIGACRSNPYKLDQIRLSLKEGMSNVYFSINDGEIIYKIRQLKKEGFNIYPIEKQLNQGLLNEEYLDYLIGWVKDGINTTHLNIAIIPRQLLSVFDYGLRQGFSMKEFNDGKLYSQEYIQLCLQVLKNGKSVIALLGREWSVNVLKELVLFSKVNDEKWNNLMSYINSSISIRRLLELIKLVKNNIPIKKLQEVDDRGNYLYSVDCLPLVYQAYCEGLDYNKMISKTNDASKMAELLQEMQLNKRKKVSGNIRKN